MAHIPNPTLSTMEVLRALLRPRDVEDVEARLARDLGCDVVLFASGRGALAAALSAVGAREVEVPAYTCVAVPNAVVTAGGTIAWRDVGSSGLAASDDTGSAVVLAQDTFGKPVRLPSGRTVVRDCCHRPDLVRDPTPLVSVTSFEQSKWLCAGEGGAAVTRDEGVARRLREIRATRPRPRQRVRHGLFTLMTVWLGRLMWRGARPGVIRPLSLVLEALDYDRLAGQSADELRGGGIAPHLAGRPNRTVAALIGMQVGRCPNIAAHRRAVVERYDRAAGLDRAAEPLCRYPMRVRDLAALDRAMQDAGWRLNGRWFAAPIHPAGSEMDRFGYAPGQAPIAEELSETIVNLPTHPLVSGHDAATLIQVALAAGAEPI